LVIGALAGVGVEPGVAVATGSAPTTGGAMAGWEESTAVAAGDALDDPAGVEAAVAGDDEGVTLAASGDAAAEAVGGWVAVGAGSS